MKKLLLFLIAIPLCVNAQYGVLDTSFGEGGIALHEQNIPDHINGKWSICMTIDHDQNIYTATNYNFTPDLTGYTNNILLSKFNSTGGLDLSFQMGGFKIINIENSLLYAYDILTSYDNYIYIIGGVLNTANEKKLMVIKLDADGNFVSDFGNNGMALYTVEAGSSGSWIRETDQNELIIAGNYNRNDNSSPGIIIMKIDSSGQLISSFADNGILKYNPSGFDVLRDLKMYRDGGFQVLDFSSFDMMTYNYLLVKFNQDGTLDTSFNQTGSTQIPLPNDNLYDFSSIQLKSDEKIVYSSNGFNGSTYYMNLSEYLPDGTINTNFGNNGSAQTYLANILPGNFQHLQRTFMLTPNDQNIIQIGYTFEGNEPFAKCVLVGFDGSGNYDGQFGNDGVVLTKIYSGMHDEPTKGLFMGDDGLLVLNGTHLSLARYKIYEGLTVEDISTNSKIMIAPNPASNSFMVKGLQGNKNEIQIIDMTGKIIHSFQKVEDGQTLNLGAIPKATYILRINSKHKPETKKLIVR